MTTCQIKSFFKAYFPETVWAIASELFDVIPVAHSIRLSEIEGVYPKDTWEFGPRINIICGVSNSGKTRVLEALKQVAGASPDLPAPMKMDFSRMSSGQTMCTLAETLLAALPEGSCLLMDDVLSILDSEHKRRLFGLMLDRRKQIIMTINLNYFETVRTLSEGMDIKFFSLTMPDLRSS